MTALTLKAAPPTLKPFLFHGLQLRWTKGQKNALADCPWCGRERKLSIEADTSLWRCLACHITKDGKKKEGGNAKDFLELLWQSGTPVRDKDLSDRHLLYATTATLWGIRRSPVDGQLIVPAYHVPNKLTTLYRYTFNQSAGKRVLYATPEFGYGLFGLGGESYSGASTVYICEGIWDAMVLWELVGRVKKNRVDVLAVPGCGVWSEKWNSLLVDKEVIFCYDNDHPKILRGLKIPPSAQTGVKRAVKNLLEEKKQPASLAWLQWGEEDGGGGCLYEPSFKAGCDLRDYLCTPSELNDEEIEAESKEVDEDTQMQMTEDGENAWWLEPCFLPRRKYRWERLQQYFQPIPPSWEEEVESERGDTTTPVEMVVGADGKKLKQLELLPCRDWETLVEAWKIPLELTDGLKNALAVMLASICSTRWPEDRLWVRIIGPAACGKTTLCEAVSTCREYVVPKSVIKGFYSGYQSDATGSVNSSLVTKLYDKTLVTKDGDTLMKSSGVEQILSQARDLYDGYARVDYKNKMSRDIQGFFMTWILCGTTSLYALDSSELGERFLTFKIMDSIALGLEYRILLKSTERLLRTVGQDANGEIEYQEDSSMVRAKQLTGGYVKYLRDNGATLRDNVHFDKVARMRCLKLSQLVAFLRARPSKKQDVDTERETATRLANQFCKLAICLAVVFNKDEVDDEVMELVYRVAMDTSHGISLDIVGHLYRMGDDGCTMQTLSAILKLNLAELRKIAKFQYRIGILVPVLDNTNRPSGRWRLSDAVLRLYTDVQKHRKAAATTDEIESSL